MLVLVRSTRGATGVSRHVRALSTIAPSANSLDTGTEQLDGTPLNVTARARRRQNRLAKSSAECMFVYPWEGIRSSAEGLSIARAVQEKYGPAKEVIFPRDPDSVTVFQPYFWLIFDGPDVRERLPEESAQIRVSVADLPRGGGNVGVEDMVRALGLSTDKGATAPLKPHPPAEGEEEVADGCKTLDVRVEWARFGPNEVLLRRRPHLSLPDKALIPNFAAAWLAFDGFSPEAARGPHTSNLSRARKKWRGFAPATASEGNDPDVATPENERASEVEADSAPAVEAAADVNVAPREWVPIIPLSFSTTPRPTTVPPKSDVDIHKTDDLPPIAAATATATAAAPVTPTFAPISPLEPDNSTEIPVDPKMSRRERILHLARQNAQTPLPELAEQPRAVVEPEKSQGESEQEGKERTIRERLWRLVGRNY